jgi:uncharacterized FAD-dependent dehydrogenase
MRTILQLTTTPAIAADPIEIKRIAAHDAKIDASRITHVEVLKRSIDARSREPKVLLKVELFIDEAPLPPQIIVRNYPSVANANRVLIIGAGPAGLFAALRLIELGIKPVILERGKDVRARRRDLAVLNREGIVNPDSNYAFGEGGAGTYSDGKLYTRSDKRGSIQRILETFVEFGAPREILVDAHPHIGTNKLPQIIVSMRERILHAGGEIHFDRRVTDLEIEGGNFKNVLDHKGDRHEAEALILATGHSARDIFALLDKMKIAIEAKPFALGVRIEHPQSLIDQMQYHCADRGEFLPPASYNFVEQTDGRGVYSFCMCPGGVIAPCSTNQEEIVTNGWSPSKRNNPFANSGVVASVKLSDLKEFEKFGELAAMRFQESVEHNAWIAGGKTQQAPAQRMIDFVEGRISHDVPTTSYQPGVVSADLASVLPSFIATAIREGLKAFGKKRRDYYTNEAVLVAPESRTSSPVRIPRDKATLMHPQISGLYPAGEGAGYAGGIVSAAIDGEKVAEAIAARMSPRSSDVPVRDPGSGKDERMEKKDVGEMSS